MIKPIKVRLIALLLTVFGFATFHEATAQVQTPRYVSMILNSNAYYEYLPQGYNPAGSETYPLLIFVHGLGELGVGSSWTLPMILRHGPPKWINYGGWPQSFTVNGQTHKFIVISPQFVAWPSSWDIDNIINYCIQNYKVNTNRIYLTGLSMGGGVTWNYASENSTFANRLAAIVPICGASWPDMTRSRVMAGANLPVWATHNNADPISPLFYTVDYVNNINLPPSPNPLAKKTIFTSASHDAWTTTYNPSFRENGLNIYEWMLQYQRGNPPVPNQLPIARAGADVTLTLPTNSVTLNGNTSSDPDGTVTAYSWRKISGPSQVTLSNTTYFYCTLSNLVAGTYVMELTVTDNSAGTGKDTVVITVTGSGTNQLPTASAGADITMTLPANWAQLNGTGTDPDGTISTYSWSKISGPASFTISNAGISNPTISTLVAGTYVLRLTVTDNAGGTAIDDINVVVNGQTTNQAPIAKAGNDITSWLPGNWAQLNGAGSSDPDGTIATYSWSKLSGPTPFTINNAGIVNPVITNLVAGVYVLRLTVTDNSGATAYDDVNVNVIGTSNQLPTANAGANITLTLPTNSAQLNGTGTDPDGTIATYSWSKISGPAQFTISNAGISNPVVSTLAAGTYVLRLTVTDNSGGTAIDDINIVVNAQTTNQVPRANAGTDITSWLPGNWAQLNGAGSSDPDGTIATYSWSKISGPTSFTINNAGIVNPVITNLVAGTYVLRLTVTDNAGATAYDEVNVNVIGGSNQLPTANAGLDVNMTLPTSSAQLNGSGSDPDGSISTYKWTKISGPATFTISNSAIANPLISNLAAGAYVFRLTVTDNSGGTAIDDINIVVNAQTTNQVPRANAGTDITSWLPGNWAQLNGAGSSDPDGTIATYSWTKVAGPTQFTINNAGIVNPIITNLVAGTYVLRLTVTDNTGASAYDEVNVYVLNGQTTNQVPQVNAGANINIFMPGNWARLNGTASDADGSIANYNWTKVSGPAQYTISNAAIINPLLTNLVVGTYVFRLTVTDNAGATASDDITIFAYSESGQLSSANTSNSNPNEEVSRVANEAVTSGTFFRLYPNPVVNNVLVELNHAEQGQLQVTLTDILGKIVRNWSFQKTAFQWRQSLNISNIAQGTYVLTIQGKTIKKTQQFIKQ